MRGIAMTMRPHHEAPHEADWRTPRFHEHDAFPQDPIHALEESLRIARAATHCKRLDTATQAALAAIVQFGHAAVDAARHLEQRIARLDPSSTVRFAK
jgi:hypothetical protein